MKNKKRIYIYSAAAVAVLLLLIIPKIVSSDKTGQKNSADKQSAVLSVEAYIAKPRVLNNKVLTTGNVLANEEVELRSEVSGKVTNILFREGTNVKKGDLLLKINDADLQAQLLRAQYISKLSEEKEYRQRKLLTREAISQEEYDAALNELNVNKSQIELIKAQIAKTEIVAPFNGRIGLRYVSVGSYITPSTDIASLQNIDPIKIDFSIPEKYAVSISPDDKINFKIVGSDKTYTGKVYAIEPRINSLTRTLNIRAVCSNSDGRLLPGAFADVELVLKDIKNALMIPTEALIPILKGQKLDIYSNGMVIQKEVITGIRNDSTVQITEGLSPYDTVITSGILQLRQGSQVTISKIQ